MQQADGAGSLGVNEHRFDLGGDPLGADGGDPGGHFADRRRRGRVESKIQHGREPHGPQHP